MKYYIVANDFTLNVDETPSLLDSEVYHDPRCLVEAYDIEEFSDFETAKKAFEKNYSRTNFELENWVDDGDDEYCIYGSYYNLEAYDDDEYELLGITSSGELTADEIDRCKHEMQELKAKGVENKYFFYDDPHYTYCPKGW